MREERGQGETTDDEAHACRPASTGTPACARHACRGTRDGLGGFGVVARAPRACREVRPGPSPRRRRGSAAVLGAGPGGRAGAPAAAGRGYDAPLRPTVGDKRWATLRRGAASLTEMVGRASFEPHGRRAGEGAR
ncbi:DUF6380 family protein [Streptomyces sp. NPDC002611]